MQIIKGIMTASYGTTERWNQYRSFVPRAGEFIVYTDRFVVLDDQNSSHNVPGLKVGDGSSYLIDLPFVGDKHDTSGLDVTEIVEMIEQHMQNNDVHVTTAEKTFWNNKVSCSVSGENLIFSTD